jgi:putative N6-adenine-specific DNA methylase
MYFVATTLKGLEEVLAAELNELGATDIRPFNRAVRFKGSFALMYKANLCLRTALRILYEIKSFPLHKESDLYDHIYSIDWPALFDPSKKISVHSAISTQFFDNSHFVSLKSKDAIVDRFRNDRGKRPDVDVTNPDISIHIHIQDRRVDVALDSSGIPLFKRQYRLSQHIAPLNEVLAAGMILMTGWKGDSDFLDPMCGSGTLAVEAAMIARGIPPGIMRENFSFLNWNSFDKALYDRMRESLYLSKEFNHKIFASDISAEAVKKANENIKRALLDDVIHLRQADFHNLKPEKKGSIAVINPPYDERIKENDIREFYKKMGDTLKRNYGGSDAWILSGNVDALKFIGLKPERKVDLLNASIKCKYCHYKLFEGSRKDFIIANHSSEQ